MSNTNISLDIVNSPTLFSNTMFWKMMYPCSITAERMGEGTGVYKVLVGGPEWRRPLRRPRYRWENNIKMGIR